MKQLIGILATIVFLHVACQHSNENPSDTESVTPEYYIQYTGNQSHKKAKQIVLVSGDEEYRSEEALPMMARILSEHHGFDCSVLFAQSPDSLGLINPNYTDYIHGLEELKQADLVILFTRFRALPDNQMELFQTYLQAGKPIIGIRTATHAFEFGDTTNQWNHWSNSFRSTDSPWDGGFGRLVLGERWHTHHGHHKHQSTRGLIASGAENHPIVNGIADGDIWGPTDVYGVRLPLPGDATPIILGQVIDRTGEFDEADILFGMRPSDSQIATSNPVAREPYNPNDPMMPIAWTKSYQLPNGQIGKSFTTTIGSSTDLLNDGVRRLWVNAVYHLLDQEVPENANVTIVGEYDPTPYSFHDDQYWLDKGLHVQDIQ